MQKPAISSLSGREREELKNNVKNNSLSDSNKGVVVEVIDFCDELLEKLKTSNISISKLKEMLLGFKSEKSKE
jgi:hypothetical protein